MDTDVCERSRTLIWDSTCCLTCERARERGQGALLLVAWGSSAAEHHRQDRLVQAGRYFDEALGHHLGKAGTRVSERVSGEGGLSATSLPKSRPSAIFRRSPKLRTPGGGRRRRGRSGAPRPRGCLSCPSSRRCTPLRTQGGAAQQGGASGGASRRGRTELARELVREVRIVLLQHARVVRVGVGHGDHRVRLARLREGGVVHARHADAERDREGRLVRAQGHLVQDDALQVALVLGGAAQVEELALRTPSTRGNGRRSVRISRGCGVDIRARLRLLNLRPPRASPGAGLLTVGA